jgi:hypothetical protein
LTKATAADEFTSAAMLEFPLPLASVPLAFGDVNSMSSMSTLPLTPLTVSANAAEGEVTLGIAAAEYCHVPPAHVRPP